MTQPAAAEGEEEAGWVVVVCSGRGWAPFGRTRGEESGGPAGEEQKHFFPFHVLRSCLLGPPPCCEGVSGLQALSGEHPAERGSTLGAGARVPGAGES